MSCAEPVSWLRLERRALGELRGEELAEVERHLTGCAVCAGAAESLRGWSGRLPALPAVVTRRRRTWLLIVPAAAAAALALVLWPRPPTRGGLKGTDVALTLVRERSDDVDLDPRTFTPADRFKLLVTCPTPHTLPWDVVVFQAGEVSFPFPAGTVACANRAPLPGALRLDGTAPVTVCLVWGVADRSRLARDGERALPPEARCEHLTPAP